MIEKGKRSIVRSAFGGFLLAGAVTVGFAGCAGASQSATRCPYAGWSGSCTLKSLNKTRQVEFPQPHAVFEAIYTPVQDPNASANVPPDTREEFKILSKNELEFQDHMIKNGTVSCQVQQTGDGACSNVKLALALPPFMPSGAGDVASAPQQKGCAKIESNPSGEPPPTPTQPSNFQPNEFFFEQNVSDVNQELVQQVNSAASFLRANPGIECIGVVGQITYGESPSLANQRAVTIRNLLLGAGIEESRLTTFTATRVYGSGGAIPETDPKERKVSLRVMLGGAGAAAPAPGGPPR